MYGAVGELWVNCEGGHEANSRARVPNKIQDEAYAAL